ncbi:T9SS type A sorting domain-containing protein [Flavobacterium rhizosphaerae]|uniref:T9SS type A sorting domain-containing protein n=1 Tax=Flavobacterium rhizosphaerae TaxID=3163298 RepID=A0ABW8YWE3_9FLAO
MKKIILLAAFALGFAAQAQILVQGKNGEEITDGYVYTSTSLSLLEQGSKLPILVTNQGDETIYVQLRMDGLENATNHQDKIQFCFQGFCYYNVTVGEVAPSNSQIGASPILAGETNNTADHFQSIYEGDVEGQPVKFHMSLIQVNSEGVLIDEIVSFTFQYMPTASVNDFAALQNIGITLKNTVVKNQLDVTANVAATLQLFTINGELVKTVAIDNGAQAIDLSGLAASVYVARFTTAENKMSQVRIVKN